MDTAGKAMLQGRRRQEFHGLSESYTETLHGNVGFEILTAVALKSTSSGM
jgi:hypothetical protein